MRPRSSFALVAALLIALSGCDTRTPIPATAPSPPATGTPDPAAARLVVIGDFGTPSDEQRAVAGAIRAERRVDALVTTGDNVYPDGHPADFAGAWEEPYGWIGERGVTVVASLGNHDVRTDGGDPVMGLLGMPASIYTRQIGPVELFVLDSNRPGDEAQLVWLRDKARASTATWRVAVFHHPPHSCGRHGSTEDIREGWIPALRAAGIDLVLSGHDHTYQRFQVSGGQTFVVTGGGGASLYELPGCPDGTPPPVASASAHHYLRVAATEARLDVEAVAVPGGRIIDSFSVADVAAAA